MPPPPLLPSFLRRILPLLLILLLPHRDILARVASPGSWSFLLPSIGISAMHMQLLNTDRVVIFDRTDFGRSNISLPAGKCRDDPHDSALTTDCTAHSVEYDVASNSVRPLTVLTDTWCSSGAASPNGTLVQTGGYNDGDRTIRTFAPCRDGSCDWGETGGGLARRRWYATNHALPDGRQIIVGGRREFNYEFYPKTTSSTDGGGARSLRFLVETNDPGAENNLYPFLFLNTDGNLFVFANNRAVLFDYVKESVLKNYPVVPGGDPRNYPSTGSAVLLPLRSDRGPEVLVCGGAPKGSFAGANNRTFAPALDTCGRIRINDPNPQWAMESMPRARVMGDIVLLPNGNVLIVNGAGSGTAGWELGRAPVLEPVIYRPDDNVGSRFEVQNPSSIPRMYHSTAVLLRDGRVLVGGSNPHAFYNFTGVLFPTELSLEAFSPSYLDSNLANARPRIVSPASHARIGYGQRITIRFNIPSGGVNGSRVMVTMVAPPFTTHSFSMNQRLLILSGGNVTLIGRTYQIQVVTPNSGNLAPPGFYLLFVVLGDVPSEGIWVQIL